MFQIIDDKRLKSNENVQCVLIQFGSDRYQAYVGIDPLVKRVINEPAIPMDPYANLLNEYISDDDEDFYGPGGLNGEFGDDYYEEKKQATRKWEEQKKMDEEMAYDNSMYEDSMAIDRIIAYGSKMSYENAKDYFLDYIYDQNLYDTETVLITYDENLPNEYKVKLYGLEGFLPCLNEVLKLTGYKEWNCFCMLIRQNFVKLNPDFAILDWLNAIIQRASSEDMSYPIHHEGFFMGGYSESVLFGEGISKCISGFDKGVCLEWAKKINDEHQKSLKKMALKNTPGVNKKDVDPADIPF